jgi:hypothetical protein
MIKRSIILVCTSALACAALLILYHSVFSDILPLAASEETQSVWRFEAAFVVTAVTWICGAVCLLSALGLVALLCHRHNAGIRVPYSPYVKSRCKVAGRSLSRISGVGLRRSVVDLVERLAMVNKSDPPKPRPARPKLK